MGGERCPESMCDCFIDQYPDDPVNLRPEHFVILFPEPNKDAPDAY
jgi:hypothetical protein